MDTLNWVTCIKMLNGYLLNIQLVSGSNSVFQSLGAKLEKALLYQSNETEVN